MKKLFLLMVAAVLSTGWAAAQNTAEQSEEEMVFLVVDEMPAFPGGEQAMLDYISQNMRYPELAREMGIQGTVIVRFAVEKDGRISTPEVVKSVDRTLDREGLRLVGQMPKWRPGSVGGTPTGVIMMLPIRFK